MLMKFTGKGSVLAVLPNGDVEFKEAVDTSINSVETLKLLFLAVLKNVGTSVIVGEEVLASVTNKNLHIEALPYSTGDDQLYMRLTVKDKGLS